MSTDLRGQRRQVRFELPHALVTITAMADDLVEIEVWPRSGVSAFVVVDADTARRIADTLRTMAPGPDGGSSPDTLRHEPEAPDQPDDGAPPGIIDLASRRRPPKGA